MQLPQGMSYGSWQFANPMLDDLTFHVEIRGDVNRTPGRYLQLYQSHIGEAGMYFGFQTDLFHPHAGGQGHGLLFSRWGSRNPEDVRPTADGWSENAGHEGDFVGVRSPFKWETGRYICTLKPVDSDSTGTWYDFTVCHCETRLNYGR